jgi:hypothetical protein
LIIDIRSYDSFSTLPLIEVFVLLL